MASITIPNFRIVATVLPVLACVVTLCRLGIRTRSRLWWWDDSFALLAMLCMVIFVGGLWAHTADPASLTRTNRIAAYYLSALFFLAVNWGARLSILFTVVRIAPFARQRKWLVIVAVAFVVGWAFLTAQVVWICETENPQWKDLPIATCDLGNASGIAQLVLETVADIVLVSIPIHFFRQTTLRKGVKLRLIAVFSTSAATTVVALIHAVFILRFGGLREATAAVIEDSIALAVCNFSVLVPVITRLCNGGSFFDPNSAEDIPLSTVQGTSAGRSSNQSGHVATTVIIGSNRGPDFPVGLNGSDVWQGQKKDDSDKGYKYRSFDKLSKGPIS